MDRIRNPALPAPMYVLTCSYFLQVGRGVRDVPADRHGAEAGGGGGWLRPEVQAHRGVGAPGLPHSGAAGDYIIDLKGHNLGAFISMFSYTM